MKFLKDLAISLLGFLLFLALTAFGLAFMLNSTVLSPDFITTEVNRLNLPLVAGDVIKVQSGGLLGGPETLTKVITRFEPQIKAEINTATPVVYDYLLGRSQSLDLKLMTKKAILGLDVAAIVDELDIASFMKAYANEFITKQSGSIPEVLKNYMTKSIDKVIVELKPWIEQELKPWMKQQIRMAAEPTVDYLLGNRQSLSVRIPLEPVRQSLKPHFRQAFLKSLPSELTSLLALISQAELERLIDTIYEQAWAGLPSTYEINQSLFPPQLPKDISGALAQAEGGLTEARGYVSLFQFYYKILIGFILLLILGIILIERQVRGATRRLGTTFLSYGAFAYIGIFVARVFALPQLPLVGIPPSLQAWIPQFANDLMAPLGTFSIALMVAGAVLLIVSFVARPRRTES